MELIIFLPLVWIYYGAAKEEMINIIYIFQEHENGCRIDVWMLIYNDKWNI